MKKHLKTTYLVSLIAFLAACATSPSNPNSEETHSSEGDASSVSSIESSEASIDPSDVDQTPYVAPTPKTREGRNLSQTAVLPKNKVDVSKMRDLKEGEVSQDGYTYLMNATSYRLEFVMSKTFNYFVNVVDQTTGKTMFTIHTPAKLYLKSDKQHVAEYTKVEQTRYGLKATANITTTNGSEFTIIDRYYYASEDVADSINIQRQVLVDFASPSDTGYNVIFGVDSNANASKLEWFVPNEANGNFPSSQSYGIYQETQTGLPMAMFRDPSTGYALSLARYQPVIEYKSNSFASMVVNKGTNSSGDAYSSVEIAYPSRLSSRRYFSLVGFPKLVYDLNILAGTYDSFDEAEVDMYTKQFHLQNQRIVDTDIDTVYNVIGEDFKSLLLTTTRNGYTSYGLPWRVTIENGLIGPKSWQAGFVGQQIPCAYNMMVYGVKNNDITSINNGRNVLDFWANKAKMITSAGVPKIWYDGVSNVWVGYPTFLRMAIDAMEGLFDAYRLAEKYGISDNGWYDAVKSCADWLVTAQNADGSWYRCYNYQGTYYAGTESDISWNPGDICRSTSKNNSTMPIRFLGKMYEHTGDTKYLTAIQKAGDFIYKSLYPQHVYYGGTCDNPDSVDKEAGVYAMYAYDTLYTLTKDVKWLTCLEQAAIFTMSSVITVSFKINPKSTDLKAANALKAGYSDGLSYICIGGTSLDNYAAYFYYELFRLYVYSGKQVYFDMAEFIQQNTKSTMDWDGTLGYAYKSLTPEASTIYTFGFKSAEDDDGTMGVWLPWQSAANAEPIAKMYEAFGKGDVGEFRDTSITDLRTTLSDIGVGGHAHKAIR